MQNYDQDMRRLEQGISSYNNKNYDGARLELTPLRQRNWPEAQYYIGMISYQKGQSKFMGLNADKDYENALRWLREAANQNYPNAYTAIAHMYDKGYGVKKNKDEAKSWRQRYLAAQKEWNSPLASTRRRADRGDRSAYYQLGQMYYYGNNGVAKNVPEAVKWYRPAAERGNKEAQFRLGWIYAKGEGGVMQNYSEAAKWFHMAANQGDADAQNYLATLYHNGTGVARNYDEAIKLYRQAIAGGEKNAPRNLELALQAQKNEQEQQRQQQYAQQQERQWQQHQRNIQRRAVIVVEPSDPALGNVWIDSAYTNDNNANFSINGRRLEITAKSGNLSNASYSIRVNWGGLFGWMSSKGKDHFKNCTYTIQATPGKTVTVPVGMSDCRIAGRGIRTSPL